MKDKIAPHNSTREVQEAPILGLIGATVEGGSGRILAQETRGQQSFVGCDTLPTDMHNLGEYATKTILEAAGVKFLGSVESDEIFQYVELPKGWKKVATDHFMWSMLVDNKGRKRAYIFYKARTYDRNAHMSLSSRFSVSFDYARFDKEKVGIANVIDGDNVIHATQPIPANGKKSFEVSAEANAAAIKWLDMKYPDWRNPSAYWD